MGAAPLYLWAWLGADLLAQTKMKAPELQSFLRSRAVLAPGRSFLGRKNAVMSAAFFGSTTERMEQTKSADQPRNGRGEPAYWQDYRIRIH